MKNYPNPFFVLILPLFLLGCNPNQNAAKKAPMASDIDQKEVLLIGTFHFNNPGADVVKTKSFDILKETSQNELEEIATDIKNYNPTKIFVEWPHDDQDALDSLYGLYKTGVYFDNDQLSNFHKKNEIIQLAFRTAKMNNLEQVHAIDYNDTEFPFDSVMQVVATTNQTDIQKTISEGIQKITSEFDSKIAEGTSLKGLLSYLNTRESRQFSNSFHNEIPLLVGDHTNFIGPYLTSEWHRRNLYMWSLVQKKTEKSDERVMVLVGSSHAAIMENFIVNNSKWKVTELNSIMNE